MRNVDGILMPAEQPSFECRSVVEVSVRRPRFVLPESARERGEPILPVCNEVGVRIGTTVDQAPADLE